MAVSNAGIRISWTESRTEVGVILVLLAVGVYAVISPVLDVKKLRKTEYVLTNETEGLKNWKTSNKNMEEGMISQTRIYACHPHIDLLEFQSRRHSRQIAEIRRVCDSDGRWHTTEGNLEA